MDKLLLTTDEAAQMLAIGRTKLYELISLGEIPTVRVGRAVRVPASALTEWVECQRQTVPGGDAA